MNKTTQFSILLIVSAFMIGITTAAAPLLEQQAKAQLDFDFGGGNFLHVNPNGHINFKLDGFHFVG